MLLGEYHHNIDDKGRLVIPTIYREELGEEFIITRGIEKCLYVYSKVEWEKLVAKLNTGRINITSPLVSYAGLTKECVIIGVNDRLEVWSKDAFNSFMKDNASELEDIAEHLFEVNDAL